ncbi:uncharacterized protein LOC26528351 isoform X2 [Drosophila mojavensis]|uniref:uncharacterized protein LOC26528351 isoform X2 n=1 Tax=Drosophila mojavensis TaxID=7230 RepID=UPI0013EEABA8|nr:uncharacterized protein LOC26528351 isoform X2 [Drosophila mojavensis]
MLNTNCILFLTIGYIVNFLCVDDVSAFPTQKPGRQTDNQNDPGSAQSLPYPKAEVSLNRSLFPMEGMELAKNSSTNSLLLIKSVKEVKNDNKKHSLPMEGVTYDDKVYHKGRLLSDEDMEIVKSYKNERFFPTDGKKQVDNMNSHEVSMEGQQNAGKVNQIKSLLPIDDMEIVKSYKNERFTMENEKPLEYKNNPLPKENLEVVESHKSEISLPIEGLKQVDNTNSQQISMEDVQNAGKVNQIESLLPLDDMDLAESKKIASIFPRKLHKRIKSNKNRKNLSKPRDRIDNMFILHHALKNRKNTNIPQHNRSKMIESLRPTNKDNRESGTTIKYINKQPKANFDSSGEKFEKFPNLLAVNHNKDLKQMILKINQRGRATKANLLLGNNAPMNYYPGKHLDSVCIGHSTIYNKPVVMDWLKTKIYSGCNSNSAQWTGPEAYNMWFAFRYNLFKNGRSEECHKVAFNTYRSYLECALMRNQRMEFLIPKYPLHQLGYVFMSSKNINENLYNSYSSYQPKS